MNRLPDKSTCEADNLIAAVKNWEIVEVDIHPNFRTLMEHKALLSTCCRTFMHTNEKDVFFLDALKVSLHRLHEKSHSM